MTEALPENLSGEKSETIAVDSGDGQSGAAVSWAPGSIVDGKYKIISCIGKGGMGTVYHVEQIFLHKHYALKTLAGEVSESHWRRFQIEAQAASMLEHPNIVGVVDFGLVDNKFPFFVMELVEGISLSDYLKKSGRLDYGDIFKVFIPLCLALQQTHGKGIVHRDVKPSNIMLIGQPGNWQCKLLDFGIARIEDTSPTTLTQTGEIVGSPLYMSPEQCSSSKVDHRSDIYSLGCTMFEAITSCPPFRGPTTVATIGMHLHEKPPKLKEASLGMDLPEDLERIVQKMLAKEPSQRFASMDQVAENLMLLQQGERMNIEVSKQSPPKNLAIGLLLLVLATGLVVALAVIFAKQTNDGSSSQISRETELSEIAGTTRMTPRDTGRLDNLPPEGKGRFYSALPKEIEGRQIRRFDFPDLDLGILIDEKAGRKYHAQGPLEIPWHNPLSFQPSPAGLRSVPQLFERFRPDELCSVVFDSNDEFTYDSLLKLEHIARLEKLSFVDTDFNDQGFQYLEKMPQLNDLNFDKSDITASGLAKFAGLKNLKNLSVNLLPQARLVILALKDGNKIEHLRARACWALKDEDLLPLATLSNLRVLALTHDKQISNASIDCFLKMKLLRGLMLGGTAVSEKGIDKLAKLTQVEYMELNRNNFSLANQQKLRKLLPTCSFYFE